MEQLAQFLVNRYGVGTLTPVGSFHHCQAYEYRTPGKHLFVKNLEPEHLGTLPDDERAQAVNQIEGLIHTYRLKLYGCGVPVPAIYETYRPNKQGCWLVEVSGHAGTSAGKLLKSASASLQREVIGKNLQLIIPVLQEDGLGIDPQPHNVVLNGPGATFADFLPAHYEDNGVTITGYPPVQDPVWIRCLTKRYFSPFGILRILRFNLMRIHSDLEEVFYLEANRLVPQWSSYLAQFRELPERRFTDCFSSGAISEAIEIIDHLDQLEVDSLREIAYRMIPRNPTLLSELFELTHLDFRLADSVRAEKLTQFKKRLKELINRS